MRLFRWRSSKLRSWRAPMRDEQRLDSSLLVTTSGTLLQIARPRSDMERVLV